MLALLAEGKFRSHYRGGILDKAKSAQPYLPFAVRDAAVAVVADSDLPRMSCGSLPVIRKIRCTASCLMPAMRRFARAD